MFTSFLCGKEKSSKLRTSKRVLHSVLALSSGVTVMAAASLARLFDKQIGHELLMAAGTWLHFLLNLEIEREDRNGGMYPHPPYVFILLNQSSLIEGVLLPWVQPLPYRIIINIEYLLLPVLGWLNVGLGANVVVRQWPWQSRRAIARAIQQLRTGDSYLISIEGKRSPDGKLQPYKKGAVVMAIEAQATIVPFFIHGAHRVLPWGEWQLRPGRMKVVLFDAISARGLTLDDRNDLIAHLRRLAEQELESEDLKGEKQPEIVGFE
jgi:1-acyl-sn-glycerol-3-phosphate acyltransferase